MNLIKVLFKQRAIAEPGCRTVNAGEVAEIPEEHFHPDVHEKIEEAAPEPAQEPAPEPEPLPVEEVPENHT